MYNVYLSTLSTTVADKADKADTDKRAESYDVQIIFFCSNDSFNS